tara:strand:- start:405 stop:626 length:222 start_codon:yes stop_codon:yes gene_type:complete
VRLTITQRRQREMVRQALPARGYRSTTDIASDVPWTVREVEETLVGLERDGWVASRSSRTMNDGIDRKWRATR